MIRLTLRMLCVLCAVMVTAAASQAFEIPAGDPEPQSPVVVSESQLDGDQDETRQLNLSYSLREALMNMPLEERLNATVRLDLPLESGAPVRSLAAKFADLWDAGRFDAAIELADDIASTATAGPIGITCQWRQPIMNERGGRSGPDVRIGARDSVVSTDFDVNWGTDNLWVVLVVPGDGMASRITWNRSVDGGLTWGEYGYYGYAGYSLDVMTAAIVGDTLYCVYKHWDHAYVFRVRLPNGTLMTFDGGGNTRLALSVGEPGDIQDLAMESNADWNPATGFRLYLTCISTDDKLFASWSTGAATTWNPITTGVTDADRGLSCCCNLGYSNYWWLVSYFDNANNICIDGYNSMNWDRLQTTTVRTSNAGLSSIAAYGDTITCVHEYKGLPELYIRYQVSYDGGNSWFWYFLDDTTTTQEAPAVSARRGGGVGAVYRYYQIPREGRYTWRDYGGAWTTPEVYTDHPPYWNQPSIEYMPNGGHGVVYLKAEAPEYRSAWFDRGPCCIPPLRGNVDYDGADAVNIVDLTTMVAYLFGGGDQPACIPEADVNGDDAVNIVDLTYITAYLFGGGPAPLPCP